MAPVVMTGVIGPNGLPLSERLSVETRSYSEITEVRPKSNQAVVLELLKNNEISNEKYIDALLEVVRPEEITHISRISRNRLCVYLTTAGKAAELVEVNKFVVVNNEQVKINYLIAKSVKVTISNADASISNTAIKRYLNHVCKIRTASSVSELKVNTSRDQLKNVHSFRRLVYIHPEDVNKLPSSQKFQGDGTTWNVFFNTGNPKCFLCGSEDHFAKQCKETDELTQSTPSQVKQDVDREDKDHDVANNIDSGSNSSQPDNTSNQSQQKPISAPSLAKPEVTHDSSADLTFQQNSSTSEAMDTTPVSKNFKRPLSTSSSEVASKADDDGYTLQKSRRLKNNTSDKNINKSTPKKQKTMSAKQFEAHISSELEPARAQIRAKQYIHKLDFDEVVKLIISTVGGDAKTKRQNANPIIKNGKKLETLDLLKVVHSVVKGAAIKNKITRLISALEGSDVLPPEVVDSEDDAASVDGTPPSQN